MTDSTPLLTDDWAGPARFLPPHDPTVRADYRHALEAPFPAQLQDAKAAVRWLRRFGPDLGGPPPHIAAKLPPELQVPPEDHLTRGLTGAALADASPITHVTPQALPFLLVHGTADWLVPYAQSEQLHAALTAAGVQATLVPVEGAQHIFDGHDDIDDLLARSVAFLTEQLP